MMAITLYLIGRAGTRKYTIAQEISSYKPYSFKILDNHLINNCLFSLLDLKEGEPIPQIVWDHIRVIRKIILHYVQTDKKTNYIFTNELYNEKDYDKKIYDLIAKTSLKRNSIYIPVKLFISYEENIKRIENPNRKKRFKHTKIRSDYDQYSLLFIDHPHLLALDVTHLAPQEAARHIVSHVDKVIMGAFCPSPSPTPYRIRYDRHYKGYERVREVERVWDLGDREALRCAERVRPEVA